MTEQFLDKYGNPDVDGDGILDKTWFAKNIVVFELPFPMVLSWQPNTVIRRFQAHKLAGMYIISALIKMRDTHGYGFLKERKIDRYGGCFNFRLIRGGDQLSNHSWGTAIDINPDIGRLGSREDADRYPRFIIDAFESEGFVWGGRWKRPDAMHFELQS
jgi:hypothetical protein